MFLARVTGYLGLNEQIQDSLWRNKVLFSPSAGKAVCGSLLLLKQFQIQKSLMTEW